MRYLHLDEFTITQDGVYAPNEMGEKWIQRDWPLMQYTGLKGKNGTEIYEGDVCEIEGGGEKTSVGKIIFEYGCFCFNPNGARWGAVHPELKYYVDMEFCEIEVIGNIYENPELWED